MKGLQASDFTILEREEPRVISAFHEVRVPEAPAAAAKGIATAPADVAGNRIGEGRLVVVFMDDSTPLEPSSARATRDAAHAIVAGLGPTDLAAVVFPFQYRTSQEFTIDHARLTLAAQPRRLIFTEKLPLKPTAAAAG